jgi:hypothetical protein
LVLLDCRARAALIDPRQMIESVLSVLKRA